MPSPDMRHVDRLIEQLMSWSHIVPLTYERAWEIAETTARATAEGKTGRVVLAEQSPLQEVMTRHGLSRSAAYRLLDRWAERNEEGRYVLDDSARDAIHEEVAVRGARSLMLRLLVEGQLIEGMGPKSEPAARRWLQRHWQRERERLIRKPSRRLDVQDAAELEAAVLAIEAAHPGLVVRRTPTSTPKPANSGGIQRTPADA